MKIYKLNIDTSKPINQVVRMQQNQTGLLSANITNDGKYIRNLSCTMYDGDNEISATDGGFKIDVGAEPKQVKVVAKSEPIMCEWEDAILQGSKRIKSIAVARLQLDAGVYSQDEFYGLAKYGSKFSFVLWRIVPNVGVANFSVMELNLVRPDWPPVMFYDADQHIMNADVPIIVEERVEVNYIYQAKCDSYTTESHTYPAIGYYTDYQMDTTIKPSSNAPYDGEYTEPLKEVEVDGVKFVPTTLSVDGVEYKVLAEAQPAQEPNPEPEPAEGE